MAFLEKPKGYYHWFKQAVRMCFPMKQDFYGLGEALWEAVCKLTNAVFYCLTRLLILLTFPISIPLITILCTRQNERVMKRRAKMMTEPCRGWSAQFTEDEVQSVLSGEKTLAQLEKEKEAKWSS